MNVLNLVPESARAALRPLLRRRGLLLGGVLALGQLGLALLLTLPLPPDRDQVAAHRDGAAPVIYVGDPSVPDASASGVGGAADAMPEQFYG